MPETISSEDLLRARMRSLLLTGAGPDPRTERDGIAGVASHLFALQGQDWRSARWALGVRAPSSTLGEIAAAFDTGAIVRSWPMRGTLHVVASQDIGWMQGVTNARPIAGAPKRREYLGISDAMLERLVQTSVQALQKGSQDRESLSAIWAEAGIEWQSNWRYHVIWWLCQNGIAVFGPTEGDPGREPRLVLTERWITEPRRLAGDEALAEFARRYAIARGPIRAKDLAWWAGIGMRDVKRGLELAVESGSLTRVRLADASGDPVPGAGGELWVDPTVLDAPSPPEWLLLPAFDEHLLGYTDRALQLEPEHFDRIVPGRNGMFLATVVHRGRVVGTWKRGKRGLPEITPLPGCSVDHAGLAPEIERWEAFHAG